MTLAATAALLSGLAIADVAFSAFRDAAGRNPRIDKRAYYRRAVTGGLVVGLTIIAVCCAAWGLLASGASVDEDMRQAGQRLLLLYGPFATLVLLGLGVRLLGDGEVRTLMSVAILGPMTLLRHGLIAAGLVFVLVTAERWETQLLAALGVTLVGSAERVFGAIRARREGRLWLGDPAEMPR